MIDWHPHRLGSRPRPPILIGVAMIPDRETAEICWAAYRKLAGGQVPAWEELPRSRQDLMAETIRAARNGALPEQLLLLWRPQAPRWAELAAAERGIWRAVQMMTLALTLD